MLKQGEIPEKLYRKVVKLRRFIIPEDGINIGMDGGTIIIRNHMCSETQNNKRVIAVKMNDHHLAIVAESVESGDAATVTSLEDLCTLMGVTPDKA